MRIVYVNGEYVPEQDAKVSIFDRAFLFADAVYEVTSVLNGKLVDFDNHMKRLKRSMKELNFGPSIKEKNFLNFHRELVVKNKIEEGIIYLQVSRGIAERDFAFPSSDTPLTITAFTQKKKLINNESEKKGITIFTIDDLRWKRCDIKTIQLLYPSIAKTEAMKKGADDAWMTMNGYVMEGSSNNAWIIKGKNIYTREADNLILKGITRQAVMEAAKTLYYKVTPKQFTVQEAENADEAFVTSATAFVTGVVKINDRKIGTGKPGVFTKALREAYIKQALKTLK
jgi:D-alanine transaminase|tara:strand:+ start:3817 stop:4668 length:852 start_codon:yes stop_codon:yes gene_type:complete